MDPNDSVIMESQKYVHFEYKSITAIVKSTYIETTSKYKNFCTLFSGVSLPICLLNQGKAIKYWNTLYCYTGMI